MWNPLTWSLPLGRVFGITVRLHILFPVVAIGLILRYAFGKDYPPGTWMDATMLVGLLFVAVLLHEFGHCFGARLVDGDASEILMWPLGGLAYVDVPHTPRANFIATAAGPLVNVVLCILSVLGFLWLTDFDLRPTWNPLWYPFRWSGPGIPEGAIQLVHWDGSYKYVSALDGGVFSVKNLAIILLARFFWVNWFLALLNLLLIGFPLDGGRLFQCVLWPYVGYRQSMLAAIFAGFIVMFIVALFGIIMNEVLPLCLAVFIFASCRSQWILLETGGEESVFGYDFSQGYTSLERDQPAPPPRKRQSWWQRWLQRRAARKLQREQEQREAEERRMDELLEKVQKLGLNALTEEEKRFMKRVSDRYRNRHG